MSTAAISTLNGAAAVSPGNAWAVGWSYINNSGQRKPLIEHWNGSACKLQNTRSSGEPSALRAGLEQL